MFIISELQDIIEIKASEVDKNIAVMNALRKKYTFKLIDDLGVAVLVSKICAISEFEIKSEILVANVNFEIIFFRFFEDEVITGKIVKQEEERIIIEDEMSISYEVHAMNLFENCEYEHSRWTWNYKGNHLPFQNDKTVRFKIKKQTGEHTVEASMDEQGLGCIEWWD